MKCEKEVMNRVKRVHGQVSGVIKMMEEERSCEDILTQLSAIRSSVDKAMALVAAHNLVNTIEENYDIQIENIESAVNLLVRTK